MLTATPTHQLEQMKGIEPSCRPWQGRVLPLNYICRYTQYFIKYPNIFGYSLKLCDIDMISHILSYHVCGVLEPIRTADRPLRRRMLYPLSYEDKWRRSWDLNPGAGFPTYRFSRPDPSATWVLLQAANLLQG